MTNRLRIILEGPDNGGKTSLAKFLQGADGVMYVHAGGPPRNRVEEVVCMRDQLNMMRSDYPNPIVLDRITPISQAVYSPDAELAASRTSWLTKILELEPVIVYCRPSTDKLLRSHEFTWRDGESEEHKERIIVNAHKFVQRYDEVMQQVPNLCYDYDSPFGTALSLILLKACRGEVKALNTVSGLLNYRR